jgi:hypothetical protein
MAAPIKWVVTTFDPDRHEFLGVEPLELQIGPGLDLDKAHPI